MEKLNGVEGGKSEVEPGKAASGTVVNPTPETDMDALLLGRMGELVSIAPNERNWRGICIALLVIVAVLALILFFIILLSPPYEGPFNPGIKFTADDIIKSEFKSSSFNGTWISGTEIVFRDPNGGVSVFNALNNSVRALMDNSTFRMYNGVEFMISADLKYVLLTKDVKQVYRNTRKARYRIQEINSPTHLHLSPFLYHQNSHNQDIPFVQEVMWSSLPSALVFVYENNIFYKPEAISNSVIYQITFTGSNYVFNGVPDWLYQEEIMKTRKCLWLSPDGKYLAFATFNDSLVGQFKYPVFKTNHQYPEIFSLPYPKVGTTNPEVTVSVANLEEIQNGSYVSTDKPDLLLRSDIYLINVVWSQNHKIAVIWMNRHQTISVISVCSKPHWKCQEIPIANITVENGWVDPSPYLIFSHDSNAFITILSIQDGEGRYPQICYVDIGTKVITPITHGRIVVTKIQAWDFRKHIIYFEAAPEGKPSQRHVYNVSDSVSLTNKWHCMTCPVMEYHNVSNTTTHYNLSSIFPFDSFKSRNRSNNTAQWPVKTDGCLFVRSHFPRYHLPIVHYILECLGPVVPKVFVMNVSNDTPTFLLNNQTALAAKYAKMAKPQIKIVQVELDSGYMAQVKLLLPPLLRDRSEMEFPCVLYVGSSPGHQGVTEEWSIDWNTFLVSSLNFVVAIVDARGSSGQSDELKFEIQKKIGTIDVDDQLFVLHHLRENYKFIDKSRTGVWGSGYGGYITGKLLEQDNGTFQCGVAVAPITSWKHHVSVWTERYMATPNVTDNYRGYEESDLTRKVSHFRDKKLLLIHGTADKLVHYQHSMLLVRAFSEQGVLFRHMTYPDEDHDFSGSSKHVLQAMEHFWNECFGPIEYEDYDEGLSFLTFAQ